MPTSLPPLPPDVGDTSKGNPDTLPGASAFSGGMSTTMQAVQQIEDGLKKLAAGMPSLLPMCAQMISQLRMSVPDALGAAAGASPGGPTGPPGTPPAITGMGQNPTALPPPPG